MSSNIAENRQKLYISTDKTQLLYYYIITVAQ